MRGEAIAVEIDNVDIDCAKREAFLEDSRAFVDERVDATFDDFLRRNFALLDSLFAAPGLHQLRDFGVRDLAALLIVAIPACARLLAEAAHFAQFVFGERLADAQLFEMAMLFANAPTDVEAGEIGDRERAHRHSEIVERAINGFDAGALFDEELSFAAIGMKHAIADESAAIPT